MSALVNIGKSIATAIIPESTQSNRLVQKFTDTGVSDITAGQIIALIITILIMIMIIGYGGSYLFNNILVKTLPSVKSISPWNFVGLYVLTQVLFT
jgi:hypothetical protein